MRVFKRAFGLVIILGLLILRPDTQIRAGELNIPGDSEGGQICKVTTMADTNVVGSFRRAMEHYNLQDSSLPSFCKKGIIFETTGTISLTAPIELNNKAASGFKLEATNGNVIPDATGVGAGNCAIVIDSNEVTVKNITIRNANGGGICIKGGSNGNIIDAVTVTRSGHGVLVEPGSQNNTIQNGFFFDNTGYGVKLDDALQNRVTKNALYRNTQGAVASPATDIQATISSAAPANQAATNFIISGTVPSAVDRCEVFRGAPSNGNSNFIVDIVNFSALSFVTTIDARQGEDIFLVCLAPDGTTSPSSTVVRLNATGTGPGTGPRPCFPNQEFPPTADFDGDGIYDVLEDKNKNCIWDGPGESDPAKPDTDEDGCADGSEDKNKNGQLDTNESDPALVDTDGDLINDCLEDKNKNGIRDSGECNPSKIDTDNDLVPDNREDLNKDGVKDVNETDCSLDDSDFDGMKDGEEDLNHDGIFDPVRECDPRDSNTDGDSLLDGSDPCCNNPATTCDTPCIPGIEPDEEVDNDGDLVPDLYEDLNHDCVVDANETDPFDKNTDDDSKNDRIDPCPVDPNPDCVAVCDPENINPFLDSDGDGLKNSDEDINGNCLVDPLESNPYNNDTDDDNTTDGNDECPLDPNPLCDEPCKPGISPPEGKDSDGDAIPDANEDINQNCIKDINETSFQKRDTDDDGKNDNSDPCPLNGDQDCEKQCFEGEFIPPQRDSDSDGLKDVCEDKNRNCLQDVGESDSYKSDSDDDGLPDGAEDKNQNCILDPEDTNPAAQDTDGDGISDGAEDKNKNGKVDFEECNPVNSDTDADGIADGLEDSNFNGVWDQAETHCARPDTDRDNLEDGAEDLNKNGTVDAGETDPRNPDTDGDGATDGQEVTNGTNPIISRTGDFNKAIGQGCGLGGTSLPQIYGLMIALLGPLWIALRRKTK